MLKPRALFMTFLVILAVPSLALARDWQDGLALELTVGSATMPYRLYLPKDYTPLQQYPIVLFMHGAGERGTNNTSQVSVHIGGLIDRTYEDYPSLLIAPQLPAGGTNWGISHNYNLTPEILDEVAGAYSADLDRLYLTGLSLGGFGCFQFLSYFGDEPTSQFRVAAMAPMSGAFDPGPYADVPQWLFHGDSDGVVNVEASRDTYRSLTGLGDGAPIPFSTTVYGHNTAIGGEVRYTELAGWGHNIWSYIYNNTDTDVYDWMFAQSVPSLSLDVDANGQADALTDGTLMLRHLFGFTGEALVADALDPSATRTDPVEIAAFLETGESSMLDVDASGEADALTDGVLILRYLFGFTGDSLVEEALDPAATRTSADDILAFLDTYQPAGQIPLGIDLDSPDPTPLVAQLSMPTTAAVPEPSAILLFGIGAAFLAFLGRRKTRYLGS